MSEPSQPDKSVCEDCAPTHVQPATEQTMAHAPVPIGQMERSLHGPDTDAATTSSSSNSGDSKDEGKHGRNDGEKAGTTGQLEGEGEEGIRPPSPVVPSVTIEFCDRCRWAPRATWIQTELFLTFPNPLIKSITLMPLNAPETGGRFRVWLKYGQGEKLVWDRKAEGGFPELKVLKQRIRNCIQPDLDLGHSDTHKKEK